MKTTTRPALRRVLATGALLVGLMGLVACGGDDGGGDDASGDAGGNGAAGVTVEGAWARTSPMAATAGAAYMTITAPDGDTLIGVAVDPSVAAVAEIHETRPVEGGSATTMAGMDHSSGGGMATEMEMVEVSSIEITAGGTELKPGGYHVMLMDLAAPLEVGQEFALTLTFAEAGTQTVTVPVLDEAP